MLWKYIYIHQNIIKYKLEYTDLHVALNLHGSISKIQSQIMIHNYICIMQ